LVGVEIRVKIGWVISEHIKPKAVDIEPIKNIAPTWGGCMLYDSYAIDNVICHNFQQSKKLIKRQIQDSCNFYISETNYVSLSRPSNVKFYNGEFKDDNINHKDEIVAMNIASQLYDVVLLLGFSFAKPKTKDKLEKHKILAYQHNVKTIIKDNESVQFVLINYRGKLSKEYDEIGNLTRDSLSNVLQILD